MSSLRRPQTAPAAGAYEEGVYNEPNQAPPDRFEAPVASVWFSRIGQPRYGLGDRPQIRPLKYAFEASKARESERDDERSISRLRGVRNSSRYAYEQLVREGELARGSDAEMAKGINRCLRSRTMATSKDNPLMLAPGQDKSPMKERIRAKPLSWVRHLKTTISLTHDEAAAPAPRLQPALEDLKHRMEEEQRLMDQYPHGLPASKRREAHQHGIPAAPLGFGFDV